MATVIALSSVAYAQEWVIKRVSSGDRGSGVEAVAGGWLPAPDHPVFTKAYHKANSWWFGWPIAWPKSPLHTLMQTDAYSVWYITWEKETPGFLDGVTTTYVRTYAYRVFTNGLWDWSWYADAKVTVPS